MFKICFSWSEVKTVQEKTIKNTHIDLGFIHNIVTKDTIGCLTTNVPAGSGGTIGMYGFGK